ncbi:FAD-dependent oxidoreductase [Runella sp.]|jgi:glycine/D-amino acid oxidase-like deaminating enzyme|uniref:NAD(P)/FAD-dependent oxidoreductase n=1 Tax=Runella sp. TaxID=1960881 RepID=UPI002628C47A|nr:FAD-dependent oxidoreductase [Runella sp.]
MTADYLIVGQGIAGSVLAWTLHLRGHHVLLLDDPTLPSASKASAGVFNPLTGKKLNRTWKADELFPFACQFYEDMQKSVGSELLHFCNIYRPFRSIEEQNSYLAQSADPISAKYVLEKADNEKFTSFIENPYGGLQITQSGWVDCSEMVEKVKTFFVSKSQYIFENFDYQHIDFQKEAVFYKNIEIKKILFCEGYEACQNPFFNWLPFNPVKGENLIVLVEDYPLTEIINQGTFILPIDGQGKCRLGATYSWDNLDWDITDEARDSLEEKIKGYLKKPYQILEQQAGIRPSTDDRRPFVGLHPEHPELGIFNGLGTKGVTLAPYFSEQFAKFLESGEDLDAEVNIERVFSLYFRSKLS